MPVSEGYGAGWCAACRKCNGVDENDRIFIKDCLKEDYDDFSRATEHIENTQENGAVISVLPACDQDECCKGTMSVLICSMPVSMACGIRIMSCCTPVSGCGDASCVTTCGSGSETENRTVQGHSASDSEAASFLPVCLPDGMNHIAV